MSKQKQLSNAIKGVILWLQGQIGVANVVPDRKKGSAQHQHKPGYSRITNASQKHVIVRAYDETGMCDLTVYAPPSKHRDAWVALLAAGAVIDAAGQGPKAKVEIKTVTGDAALTFPMPKPVVDATMTARVEIYDVTPDLAIKWLEHNTRNRKLRQSVVNRYAQDLREGRWMVGPDAVAFDVNGAIVNGQHRLWAIVETGITVRMSVMVGLQPEVVAVLDDHLKRSLTDVATIRRPGTAIQTVHAAIANQLLQSSILMHAVERHKVLERISRQDQLASLDRHWDAIEFVVRDCFRSSKLRGVVTASTMTPMARAYYTQSRDRLREFGKVMMTGMTDRLSEDQPAILLRNMLMRNAASGVRSTPDVVYRKTERALAAFLEGTKLSTLYEASSELFPLPEDQPMRKK